MFPREVRFYREIAPVVGVRVPDCFEAVDDHGTLLRLEDLSSWTAGADPVRAAVVLGGLHRTWAGRAVTRWPWLAERHDADVVDLVGGLFDDPWIAITRRSDIHASLETLGDVFHRSVTDSLATTDENGGATLLHGDASTRNMRTSAAGEMALLDWEDVGVGPGRHDLAWLLVSSVEPTQWDACIAAYGEPGDMTNAFTSSAVQGVLSLADSPIGSAESEQWQARLREVSRRLMSAGY